MFKVLLSASMALLALLAAITYIPSLSEAMPYLGHFRDIAAPVAVIAALTALFVWTPSDQHNNG